MTFERIVKFISAVFLYRTTGEKLIKKKHFIQTKENKTGN